MFNWKKFLFGFSILFVSIYFSVFFMTYFSSWYEFNYDLQNTYSFVNETTALIATNDLIDFFMFKDNLNHKLWNEKEILHFKEVRDIFLDLHLLFILCITSILFISNSIKLKDKLEVLKINMWIVMSFVLILPFFAFFWDKIFHPILFSNSFWILYPGEMSYYLFDYSFFINSLILLIIVSFGINYGLRQYYLKLKSN